MANILDLDVNTVGFVTPTPNSDVNCCQPERFKLVSRLKPCLSELLKNKYKPSFQDLLNQLFKCGPHISLLTSLVCKRKTHSLEH